MDKEETPKETIEYLKRLDEEKELNDKVNPFCSRCRKRIFWSVYAVEDKDLEKDELVFHKDCYDKDYVTDYLNKKSKAQGRVMQDKG